MEENGGLGFTNISPNLLYAIEQNVLQNLTLPSPLWAVKPDENTTLILVKSKTKQPAGGYTDGSNAYRDQAYVVVVSTSPMQVHYATPIESDSPPEIHVDSRMNWAADKYFPLSGTDILNYFGFNVKSAGIMNNTLAPEFMAKHSEVFQSMP